MAEKQKKFNEEQLLNVLTVSVGSLIHARRETADRTVLLHDISDEMQVRDISHLYKVVFLHHDFTQLPEGVEVVVELNTKVSVLSYDGFLFVRAWDVVVVL